MPYMLGKAPIRRTIKYLEAGRLFLNERIKVMSIHYNFKGDNHNGIREFLFWYVPQIQYQNPLVQVVSFKNLTPSPFIRCFYDNNFEMLIDCDSKRKEDILEHCIQVIGKSKVAAPLHFVIFIAFLMPFLILLNMVGSAPFGEQLSKEASLREEKENPAFFGIECQKSCICEVPGQVPCPAVCPLPHHMRGKYIFQKDD